MRIHLKIDTNEDTIPFNHQPLLVGTIHKWLGWNEEHGKVSLYSFSQLEGGLATTKGLKFKEEAFLFFSSYDPDLIKKVVRGIKDDPMMFHGLDVKEVIIEDDPDLSGRDLFFNASPIFIKRRFGETVIHILFDDPRANSCLKETLKTKMVQAGIRDDSFDIRFDRTYSKAGTKMINYNGIQNRANWCPVIIEGKPETKLFAWNVGLGNSTGTGFGAIR